MVENGNIMPGSTTRHRYDVFKAWMVQTAEFSGVYELPVLKSCLAKPSKAIPFDKALKTTVKNQWVHFFIDDYRFERIWNNPSAYLDCLKGFDGVISTDFSLYRDMRLSLQIWNNYRNRAVAYWLQKNGVETIPNIRFGDERTYDFCFEGIAQGGTVAVGTHGCIQRKPDRCYFKKGLSAMIDKIKPDTILVYGQTPPDIFDAVKERGIGVIGIPCHAKTVRKAAI